MKTRIIKDLIKRVVDYRIEGDYHVYTVIITWEVVMAAMENI